MNNAQAEAHEWLTAMVSDIRRCESMTEDAALLATSDGVKSPSQGGSGRDEAYRSPVEDMAGKSTDLAAMADDMAAKADMLKAEIDSVMAFVPERCSFAIEMRYIWGEPTKAIADSIGVSDSTTKRLMLDGLSCIGCALRKCY